MFNFRTIRWKKSYLAKQQELEKGLTLASFTSFLAALSVSTDYGL